MYNVSTRIIALFYIILRTLMLTVPNIAMPFFCLSTHQIFFYILQGFYALKVIQINK